MAAIHSKMLPLGTIAPEFDLLDTISGSKKSLQDLKGDKGTLVMFICNHCPYVIHIKDQLIDIARNYDEVGVKAIAISSNEIVHYPQDAPDKMKQLMDEWSHPFAAYLFDESQEVAKSYQAACTPEVYVFDSELKCVYHGRVDGATPNNEEPKNGKDLRNALDRLIAGKGAVEKQLPSIGCNIKWK